MGETLGSHVPIFYGICHDIRFPSLDFLFVKSYILEIAAVNHKDNLAYLVNMIAGDGLTTLGFSLNSLWHHMASKSFVNISSANGL